MICLEGLELNFSSLPNNSSTLLRFKPCFFLKFRLHRGKPSLNWFFPSRWIKDWFQLVRAISLWTREWLHANLPVYFHPATGKMQNMLWITHLRIKWYNEKVGALNSKKTEGKFLLNARRHSRLVTQPVSNVTYVPHRLSTFGNFDEVWNTCKISTVKSLTTLWIKRLTKPLEKNISSKGIFQKGKRVTSAVRYVHFPVLLRICLLTTTLRGWGAC